MSTRRVTLGTCAIAAVLALGGCADEPCRSPDVGGLLLPPPESLAVVADEVRDAGGLVLVGAVGSVSPLPPERIDVGGGYSLEYPRKGATASVIDDLGAATAMTSFAFCGSAGRSAVTDSQGCATDELVVGDIDASFPWMYVPESSEPRVLFVLPARDCGWLLRWQAALDGDLVESIGTASDESIPLESLRLEP